MQVPVIGPNNSERIKSSTGIHFGAIPRLPLQRWKASGSFETEPFYRLLMKNAYVEIQTRQTLMGKKKKRKRPWQPLQAAPANDEAMEDLSVFARRANDLSLDVPTLPADHRQTPPTQLEQLFDCFS